MLSMPQASGSGRGVSHLLCVALLLSTLNSTFAVRPSRGKLTSAHDPPRYGFDLKATDFEGDELVSEAGDDARSLPTERRELSDFSKASKGDKCEKEDDCA